MEISVSKIIRQGPWIAPTHNTRKSEYYCTTCDSIIEFNVGEVQIKRTWPWFKTNYADCPVCKENKKFKEIIYDMW